MDLLNRHQNASRLRGKASGQPLGLSPNTKVYWGYKMGTPTWFAPEEAAQWKASGWVRVNKNGTSGTLYLPGTALPNQKVLPAGVPVKVHKMTYWDVGRYHVLTSRPGQMRNKGRGAKGIRTSGTSFPQRNPELTVGFNEAVCYDAVSGMLVSADPKYSGQPVELVTMGDPDDQGRVEVSVKSAAFGAMAMFLCQSSAQPPNGGGGGGGGGNGECCANIESMMLECTDPNDPLHGATIIEVMQIHDNGLVTLSFQGPQGNILNGRFMLCEPGNGDGDGDGDGDECCYDAINGVIVCDDPTNPLHGLPADVQNEEDGFVQVCFQQGSAQQCIRIPLCKEPPPIECCYDLATGKLRCPGNAEYDGLEVSLDHLTDVMEDGKVYAQVSHPDLPGGMSLFPLCYDEVPPECCYDGKTGLIICTTNEELDGQAAGVVHKFQMQDGTWWVYVAWNGGGARMPLCDEECPPVFCCVNVHTNTFVCPGGEGLNGQPADVTDVITDGNGFNFAQLADGTLVPICGAECPPPEQCPECPPGMWMSPDKECRLPPDCPECPEDGVCPDPEPCICPQCPPGGGNHTCPDCPPCPGQCACPVRQVVPPPWVDQGGNINYANKRRTAAVVSAPQYNWWSGAGHCCESCALGMNCEGCVDCGGHKRPKMSYDDLPPFLTRETNPLRTSKAPSSKGVWYPASYKYNSVLMKSGKPWVWIQKGSKYGLLRIPGPMQDKKVYVNRVTKDIKGQLKARVKAVQLSARTAVVAGPGMQPRDHVGECSPADIKNKGCYSISSDMCYVPCEKPKDVTAPPGGIGGDAPPPGVSRAAYLKCLKKWKDAGYNKATARFYCYDELSAGGSKPGRGRPGGSFSQMVYGQPAQVPVHDPETDKDPCPAGWFYHKELKRCVLSH